jgi:DNA primase small subunit
MDFKEASIEERKIYYGKEWKEKDVPEFIVKRITEREFAFDHDGTGYNDRYKEFNDLSSFSKFMLWKAPYAVCTSVSFYKYPSKREGWDATSELVFDIDAKDLQVKSCECPKGKVCEKCLEDAKEIAITIGSTLKNDLGANKIHFVYSGRGYHIRVLDEEIMKIQRRSEIVEYVTGSKRPKEPPKPQKKNKSTNKIMDFNKKIEDPSHIGMFLSYGYPAIYRKMFSLTFLKLKKSNFLINDLSDTSNSNPQYLFSEKNIETILSNKKTIVDSLNEKNRKFLNIVYGETDKENKNELLDFIQKINASLVDGKVTVDVKRILRLPSTLHSKVSMKCVEIKNIDNFDPLKHAVPKFAYERKD